MMRTFTIRKYNQHLHFFLRSTVFFSKYPSNCKQFPLLDATPAVIPGPRRNWWLFMRHCVKPVCVSLLLLLLVLLCAVACVCLITDLSPPPRCSTGLTGQVEWWQVGGPPLSQCNKSGISKIKKIKIKKIRPFAHKQVMILRWAIAYYGLCPAPMTSVNRAAACASGVCFNKLAWVNGSLD